MTSATIKAAFAAAGIKVRVRDLDAKFRICTLSGEAHNQAASVAVASSLGMTDCLGRAGGTFEGYVMWSYKPGAIVRA